LIWTTRRTQPRFDYAAPPRDLHPEVVKLASLSKSPVWVDESGCDLAFVAPRDDPATATNRWNAARGGAADTEYCHMINPNSRAFGSKQPSHAEVVESLPHIVWTAQPDGQVDWLSREFEQYTGIADARNVQSGWMQAIHEDDRDNLKESWTESTESAHGYKTEVRVWCARSKDWRVNMISARAQLSPEGEVIRWFGTVTDIQSLYDAEAERSFELQFRKLESEVLRAIGTGGTLNQIFTLICCKVEELLPDARTVITHVTPDGRLGEGFSIRLPGAFMDSCKGIPIGPKAGTCGTAAYRRDLVVIDDTLTDPLWEGCRDLAVAYRLRSSVSCPVLDEAGNSVATLALHFPEPSRPTNKEFLIARRLAEFVFLALSATRDRELLLQSETRYRSLFNLMPVSVWEEDISAVLEELEALKANGVEDFRVWLKDNPDFVSRMVGKIRIVGVNQTTLTLHGAASLDELAQRLMAFGSDPELQENFAEHLAVLFEGRTFHESQRSFVAPDGKTLDLLLRIIRPSADSPRLLVVEMDLTDQRRAEHRFRTIAQATSDVIYERDVASDHVWVSNGISQHFGYPAFYEGHPRTFWVDNVHPEDRGSVLGQIDRAMQTGLEDWSVEYRFRKFDGSFVPVRENAVIVRDFNGKPIRVIGNMVDLSEQKALEEQLRRAQRMEAVGQLTGGIAHDFNNILAIIIGNAEFLMDSHPEGSPERRLVENIDAAAERASELTGRLLAFSRRQTLLPKQTDVNAVIRNTHALLARSLTPAVQLDLDLAEDAHFASIDQPMFESAILNLCVNARDAMPSGGVLTITTRNAVLDGRLMPGDVERPQPGRYIEVRVSDTGTGMTPEVRARIFEPFFTTKPAGKGSGLGLPMVYGFAKQSRGHLHVESAPETGTSISIYLPVIACEDLDHSSKALVAASRTTPSLSVLVVEDEQLVRDHLVAVLETMGHSVVAAPTAPDALSRIGEDAEFDLIISDIVMPGGMSGVEMTRTLRRAGVDTPILLVSGYTEDLEQLSDDMDDRLEFMKKPYRRSELLERMHRLLSTVAA